MIIEGNKVTLYTDETHLQPTPQNAYIDHTLESWNNLNSEGIMVHRENYRRIMNVFKDFPKIEIQVKSYD